MNPVENALERLERTPDDGAFAEVATSAPTASPSQLARLALTLGLSQGTSIGPPCPDVVDIASTGGPGSLSTLLAPLYAHELGMRVSKIAVPGRPAGGLDVLGSLAGYRVEMDENAARRVLDSCGYLHVAAGRAFCPLDARFFAWRQANGHQAVPHLVITSLLAKKLAAGVGRFVVDVRVGPHGNLGTTIPEARMHARRLIAVAAELNIEAICVIRHSSGTPQPWIGRGEAIVALSQVLSDRPEDAVLTHAADCRQMALLAAGATDGDTTGTAGPHLTSAHETMLRAHGCDPDVFWNRQAAMVAAHRVPLIAEAPGRLTVNLAELRMRLAERQRQTPPSSGASFSDPCGLYITPRGAEPVTAGAVVARVRDDNDAASLTDDLRRAFRTSQGRDVLPEATVMEVVRG